MILVVDRCPRIVSEVHTQIDGQIQTVKKGILIDSAKIQESAGRNGVPFVISLVVEEFRLGIESLCSDTVRIAVIVCRSVVILSLSILVKQISALFATIRSLFAL